VRGRIGRLTKLGALVLLSLIIMLTGSGLAYRTYRQHQIAKTLIIATPNGINERLFVTIGGVEQWISIRGRNRDNPVLLVLHGGPGVTTSPLAVDFLDWESDFTVVHWDQRGAGKTYGRSGPLDPTFSIDQMAQDGLEVADFLRHHVHQDKIILLGWSWGSIPGVQMAKLRPDLFYAYVGTGQLVNLRENYAVGYARLLGETHARHDARAAANLESIGPPPWRSIRQLGVYSTQALAYESGARSNPAVVGDVFLAPGCTLGDFRDWLLGLNSSQNHFFGPTMAGPLMNVDLASPGTAFATPMFVFQGAQDYIAPPQLAHAYVDGIRAPQKQFVLIGDGGHTVVVSRNDEFLRLLDRWVRPLATQQKSAAGPAQ
jgi:pimeloyl-ACP methyl ester carboxylesterase